MVESNWEIQLPKNNTSTYLSKNSFFNRNRGVYILRFLSVNPLSFETRCGTVELDHSSRDLPRGIF